MITACSQDKTSDKRVTTACSQDKTSDKEWQLHVHKIKQVIKD